MACGPFRLVAETHQEEAAAERVRQRLCQAFGCQVTLQQLRSGAAVFETDSLASARNEGQRVSQAGAGFRILDASGQVVSTGPAELRPVSVPVAGIAQGAPSAPLADSFAMDTVGADDLIMLDGETGEGPFDAPVQDWALQSLEVAKPEPSVPSGQWAVVVPDNPVIEDRPPMDDSDASIDVTGGVEMERPLGRSVATVPRGGPIVSPQTSPPAVGGSAGAAPVSNLHTSPPAVLSSAGAAPIVNPQTSPPAVHRSARAAPSATTARLRGGRLFSGRLRSVPRLRLLSGFALALLLGSVLPMCHARAVRRERLEPARLELSKAKAFGHLLSTQPGYRSPDQLEQAISSIAWRHGISSFLMWLLGSSVLLWLWLRFT